MVRRVLSEGSALEFVLLGLLHQAPLSGYDLRRILTLSPMRHFSSSPGAIYPALRRLASRKWIDVGRAGGGRGRQELRANARGRRAFVNWLRRPITRDDVVLRPGDLLLRCAFLEPVLPPAAIRRFLRDYATQMAAYLEDLRRYDADHGDAMPHMARLVFRHGVASYESSVDWARRALKELAGRDAPRTARKGR
jgi:DNA-binding PadR family transcriptional regulator